MYADGDYFYDLLYNVKRLIVENNETEITRINSSRDLTLPTFNSDQVVVGRLINPNGRFIVIEGNLSTGEPGNYREDNAQISIFTIPDPSENIVVGQSTAILYALGFMNIFQTFDASELTWREQGAGESDVAYSYFLQTRPYVTRTACRVMSGLNLAGLSTNLSVEAVLQLNLRIHVSLDN